MSTTAGSGYSGTPLPRKLGIGDGAVVAVLDDPGHFRLLLGPLPASVELRDSVRGKVDVAVLFVTRRAALVRRLPAARRAIFPDGGLWVAWPKRSSGAVTDMSEDVVREVGLPTGLVDNKVCAIDDTWSGLRLVHRRELRRQP